MPKLKIGLLYGGKSAEHEVSVHSAQTVCELLEAQPERYEVVKILIEKNGGWFKQTVCGSKTEKDLPVTPVIVPGCNIAGFNGEYRENIDVFFPVLHGTNGEDGTMQGLLEVLDAPYVGCGVLTSAMGMDKEVSKLVAWKNGLNVLEYKKLSKSIPYDEKEISAWVQKIGLPVFVKPVCLGSSVGVTKVKTVSQLQEALAHAFKFDNEVMIEKGVDHAREFFCGIFGSPEEVLVSQCGELEIVKGEFFDYDAKYVVEGGCVVRIPEDVKPDALEEMRKQSEVVFRGLRGNGFARIDFLMGSDGKFYFSEINTIPGLSYTSLFPQLFEAGGINYMDILNRLIDMAVNRHCAKAVLSVNRKI